MKRILLSLLVLALIVPYSAQAEDVYRWVDENGKVHFGRTLPPEHGNKPYVILNAAGMVIERVDDPMAKALAEREPEEEKKMGLEPLFTADEVRLRSDNLMMLRYHTEKDLIDAMENEVDQLAYDARLINQSQSSAMTTLKGQVKSAADRQRAGMPGDAELEKNIRSLRSRLRRSEKSLTGLRLREDKIRADFQEDIERYQYLTSGGIPGSIEPGPMEPGSGEPETAEAGSVEAESSDPESAKFK